MKHQITTISKAIVAICVVLLFAPFVAGASAGPSYQFYTPDENGGFVFGINNSRLLSRVYGDAQGNAYTDLFWNGKQMPVVYPGSSVTLMGDVDQGAWFMEMSAISIINMSRY